MNFIALIQSFGYAFEGLEYALKHNQNLRIHFVIAIVAIGAAIFFHLSDLEFALVGVMIVFSISAELINTSIEQMIDLITEEHRKQAKIAKDVGAGMVLFTSFASFIVGILVFLPHIIRFFGFYLF
jgi:diacylglycerol kinase